MLQYLQDSLGLQLAELSNMIAEKLTFSVAVTWFLQAAGHPDTAIVALYVLWVADFCLGFYRGVFKDGSPNIKKAIHGAMKIFRYWLVICLTVWFDDVVGRLFPGQYVVTNIIILIMASSEMLSCIDHIHYLGIYKFDERFIAKIRDYKESVLNGLSASNQRANEGPQKKEK